MNQAGLSWDTSTPRRREALFARIETNTPPTPETKILLAGIFAAGLGRTGRLRSQTAGDSRPPFPGHRWLPARHLNNTDKTPIVTTEVCHRYNRRDQLDRRRTTALFFSGTSRKGGIVALSIPYVGLQLHEAQHHVYRYLGR